MGSKLSNMRNRYLEVHLSSSRGRFAKSIKIYFFSLVLIITFILSILTSLIIFSVFYFNSINDVINSKDVDKYIKDKLGQLKTDIRFIEPIKQSAENINAIISQGIKKDHHGIDIATDLKTDVLASSTGKVLYTGVDSIYGNVIILSHQNNFYTFYGHLNTILVNAHDFVKTGDVIGLVGQSGIANGPHLHFEIWGEDGFKDPAKVGFNIKGIN